MHIDRWVKFGVISGIAIGLLSAIPGWIGVFRPTNVIVQSNPSNQGNATPGADQTLMHFLDVMRYVGPIVSAGLLLTAAIVAFKKRSSTLEPSAPRLKIHSAFYGTGALDDRDVSERLRKQATDGGLVISVDNNTLGCDPAPGRPKRIRVSYSYLNDVIHNVVRWEYARLILPVDTEYIERLEKQHEQKEDGLRRAVEILEAQKNELSAAHLKQLEQQKGELADQLKRGYEQEINVLRLDFSSKYGTLKQEYDRLTLSISQPVIRVTWGQVLTDERRREHDSNVNTFQSLGMPRDAAELAAIGRDGGLEESGFTLLYNGADDPLENVTIGPLSYGVYSATFQTLPFLERGKPGYLIPNVTIDGSPAPDVEFKKLLQGGELKFSVSGGCRGRKFDLKYRAERSPTVPGGIDVYPGA